MGSGRKKKRVGEGRTWLLLALWRMCKGPCNDRRKIVMTSCCEVPEKLAVKMPDGRGVTFGCRGCA